MGTAIHLSASFNSTSSNLVQGRKCKHVGQSVRALPIRILSVGKKRPRGLQLMVDEYIEKLKYYCSVEDVQIRPNPRNARDQRAQVDDEDTAVMNLIRVLQECLSVLVDPMVMEEKCGNVLTYQSSYLHWS